MGIRILLGDCRDKLNTLKDGSVDLFPTDPPYAISRDVQIARKGGKFGRAATIDLDFGEWDKEGGIRLEEWVPLCVRKLTDAGVFISFYDQHKMNDLEEMLKELGMTIRGLGFWHKRNPAPQARKVKWQTGSEQFIIATKNRGEGHHYNFGEGQASDVIEAPVISGHENLGVPTQKPEAVIEPMIRWWSFEGDLVVDPFAGSGTTGAVCQRLNRRCILIEQKPSLVDLVVNRLSRPLGAVVA